MRHVALTVCALLSAWPTAESRQFSSAFGQQEGQLRTITRASLLLKAQHGGQPSPCCKGGCPVNSIDTDSLPRGTRMLPAQEFGPATISMRPFNEPSANQTRLIVSNIGLLLEIEEGVTKLCGNGAASVSNKEGFVFQLNHWVGTMCSPDTGFACTGSFQTVSKGNPPWPRYHRVESAITFLSWCNGICTQRSFDTMAKLNYTCSFMAAHPTMKILVHNNRQRQFITEICETYKVRKLRQERFRIQKPGGVVIAGRLYFPFLFSKYTSRVAMLKDLQHGVKMMAPPPGRAGQLGAQHDIVSGPMLMQILPHCVLCPCVHATLAHSSPYTSLALSLSRYTPLSLYPSLAIYTSLAIPLLSPCLHLLCPRDLRRAGIDATAAQTGVGGTHCACCSCGCCYTLCTLQHDRVLGECFPRECPLSADNKCTTHYR
jgi:hypothetical protein